MTNCTDNIIDAFILEPNAVLANTETCQSA